MSAAPKSKACGFVLVRESAGVLEYLLLVNRRRGEPGLPKGHEEPGETEVETALRETREETGLTDLDVDPFFRRALTYPALRRGVVYDKTTVYLLARWRAGEVLLSEEHVAHAWEPLKRALARIPHPNLRGVVRDAALYLKDPALFLLEEAREPEAAEFLASLPHADAPLQAHLKGGARLARVFAEALSRAEVSVHVEAAAVGTLLHDVGRAIGQHADHPRAGLEFLRGTRFPPYGFACVSHFTKGASREDLLAAGVAPSNLDALCALIDARSVTWEERCAALADSCMKGPTPVNPTERFRDLRVRYDAPALIALQERRTEAIRREIAAAIGRDPLSLVGLAS